MQLYELARVKPVPPVTFVSDLFRTSLNVLELELDEQRTSGLMTSQI